eukprot:g44187.t1
MREVHPSATSFPTVQLHARSDKKTQSSIFMECLDSNPQRNVPFNRVTDAPNHSFEKLHMLDCRACTAERPFKTRTLSRAVWCCALVVNLICLAQLPVVQAKERMSCREMSTRACSKIDRDCCYGLEPATGKIKDLCYLPSSDECIPAVKTKDMFILCPKGQRACENRNACCDHNTVRSGKGKRDWDEDAGKERRKKKKEEEEEEKKEGGEQEEEVEKERRKKKKEEVEEMEGKGGEEEGRGGAERRKKKKKEVDKGGEGEEAVAKQRKGKKEKEEVEREGGGGEEDAAEGRKKKKKKEKEVEKEGGGGEEDAAKERNKKKKNKKEKEGVEKEGWGGEEDAAKERKKKKKKVNKEKEEVENDGGVEVGEKEKKEEQEKQQDGNEEGEKENKEEDEEEDEEEAGRTRKVRIPYDGQPCTDSATSDCRKFGRECCVAYVAGIQQRKEQCYLPNLNNCIRTQAASDLYVICPLGERPCGYQHDCTAVGICPKLIATSDPSPHQSVLFRTQYAQEPLPQHAGALNQLADTPYHIPLTQCDSHSAKNCMLKFELQCCRALGEIDTSRHQDFCFDPSESVCTAHDLNPLVGVICPRDRPLSCGGGRCCSLQEVTNIREYVKELERSRKRHEHPMAKAESQTQLCTKPCDIGGCPLGFACCPNSQGVLPFQGPHHRKGQHMCFDPVAGLVCVHADVSPDACTLCPIDRPTACHVGDGPEGPLYHCMPTGTICLG